MSDGDEPDAARRFIANLSAAAPDQRALATLADDVEGFSQAVDQAPAELGEVLRLAEATPGGMAILRIAAFASAASDRAGQVLAADEAFAGLAIAAEALDEVVGRIGDLPRISALVDDVRGRRIAVAVASTAASRDWPLDPTVRRMLDSGRAAYAILAVRPLAFAAGRAAEAYGLTGLQTRVTHALSATGDLRRAAEAAGVSYETAREAVAGAMAKTGARRQPALIQQLTSLAVGDLGAETGGWRAFADIFDLTARQAKLTWSVAHGATRDEAARAAGVSGHAAKTELRAVYEICGVSDAADLGRLAGEVEALAALATAADIQWSLPLAGGDAGAPLRLVRRRRSPGRIAVEDHGPAEGSPVIVLHTPTSGRRLPRVLVRAMHRAGLRPISVERPGYGLTSPVTDAGHPFTEAGLDLIDVLDTLHLNRVRLLGRSSIAALAFAAQHSERVMGGVLLGPSSAHPDARRRDGLLGAIVSLVLDQPQLVRGFATMLIRGATPAHIRQVSRAIAQRCPADLAALDDPEIFADHLRACQQAALGGAGIVGELPYVAESSAARYAQPGDAWRILMGEHDPMRQAGDPTAGWTAVLPGVAIEVVSGAGRFAHYSHPDVVATALRVSGNGSVPELTA